MRVSAQLQFGRKAIFAKCYRSKGSDIARHFWREGRKEEIPCYGIKNGESMLKAVSKNSNSVYVFYCLLIPEVRLFLLMEGSFCTLEELIVEKALKRCHSLGMLSF